MYPLLTAERDQRDFSFVAGLKAQRGTCRDVEPVPERQLPVELQGPIDLEEVEVGADLDRPVAGIAHRQLHPRAPRVDLDGFRGEDVAANRSTHVSLLSFTG